MVWCRTCKSAKWWSEHIMGLRNYKNPTISYRVHYIRRIYLIILYVYFRELSMWCTCNSMAIYLNDTLNFVTSLYNIIIFTMLYPLKYCKISVNEQSGLCMWTLILVDDVCMTDILCDMVVCWDTSANGNFSSGATTHHRESENRSIFLVPPARNSSRATLSRTCS